MLFRRHVRRFRVRLQLLVHGQLFVSNGPEQTECSRHAGASSDHADVQLVLKATFKGRGASSAAEAALG